MDSNTIFYFALGLLLGLVAGGALVAMILSAAMLSSRISQADEEAEAHD